MIVDPYRRNPRPPLVALLLPSGEVVSESGAIVDLDDWPPDHRLWASYETVYTLVREGRGEALCWRGEEIRWRHKRMEDEWTPRASDANVIKLPFSHLRPEAQLHGFCLWRDWLASYGASPTGTSGSAAWSLLRARLERRLVTSSGERPPIRFTVGGRQVLGPGGRGAYRGELRHLDIPAAYASTLASLRYGGVWLQAGDSPGRRWEELAGSDTPVFLRARVRVPSQLYGPLVRRPRRRPRSWLESAFLGSLYPAGEEIQGVWTWEEVEAARLSGCSVRVIDGWVHRAGRHPFAPWWEAIVEGRALGGFAGALAKMTGNALWGRFAMDPSVGGVRSIRSLKGKRLHSRRLTERPSLWPAHDLAETVSGRVRARLYLAMMEAGDGLVCAHTDGLWMMGGGTREADAAGLPLRVSEATNWRLKESARRLELLDPQVLRYWPPRARGPHVVYAGVPAELAESMFSERWDAFQAGVNA